MALGLLDAAANASGITISAPTSARDAFRLSISSSSMCVTAYTHSPRGALLTGGARIARRRRRQVGCRGRAEQLTEDWLQRVRPELIALERRMQVVALVQHALYGLAVGIGQTIVDVEEAHAPAVGERSQLRVDPSDRLQDGGVVATGENRSQDDRRVQRLPLTDVDDGLDAARDLRDGLLIAGLSVNV